MDQAACKGMGADVQMFFCCIEEDVFVKRDGVVIRIEATEIRCHEQSYSGLEMQRYVVDRFCTDCPVNWECARWGVEVEENEPRTCGAWAMPRSDRAWLSRQGNLAFTIIDKARLDGVPVHLRVAQLRRVRV